MIFPLYEFIKSVTLPTDCIDGKSLNATMYVEYPDDAPDPEALATGCAAPTTARVDSSTMSKTAMTSVVFTLMFSPPQVKSC
jgi:hypothetical protein